MTTPGTRPPFVYNLRLKDPRQLNRYPQLGEIFHQSGRILKRFETAARIIEGEIIELPADGMEPKDVMGTMGGLVVVDDVTPGAYRLKISNITRRASINRDSRKRFSDGSYDDVPVSFDAAVTVIEALLSVGYLEPCINDDGDIDVNYQQTLVAEFDAGHLALIQRIGAVGNKVNDIHMTELQKQADAIKSRLATQ